MAQITPASNDHLNLSHITVVLINHSVFRNMKNPRALQMITTTTKNWKVRSVVMKKLVMMMTMMMTMMQKVCSNSRVYFSA